MDQAARLDLIRNLRERARQIESSARSALRDEAPPLVLGELLLGRGLEAGTLVEWQGDGEGCGAVTLALLATGHILRDGGVCVVIDPAGEFYPPAAAALGVAPEQTILVRPGDARGGLWAWEQALRCGAVAVTLGRVGGLNERHFHRLQLAAEAGGRLGFLLRTPSDRAAPSRAAIRLRVSARSGPGPPQPLARRLCVELLHGRGGAAGAFTEVELTHETNHVRLVSELAHPAPARLRAYA